MAKAKRSLLGLSGTIGGLTHVQSGAYGYHVRLPRGTIKPAHVNNVLEQNAGRAKKVTAFAKQLHYCFKDMAKDFIQRQLWQAMLKRMFAVKTTSVHELLLSMEELELNKAYKLEKILGTVPPVKVTSRNNRVNIQMSPLPKPDFPGKGSGDSYRYELFITWIDGKGTRFEGDAQNSRWIGLEEDAVKLSFNFTKQKWVKNTMIVLKIDRGLKGEPDTRFAGTGMRVMKVVGEG